MRLSLPRALSLRPAFIAAHGMIVLSSLPLRVLRSDPALPALCGGLLQSVSWVLDTSPPCGGRLFQGGVSAVLVFWCYAMSGDWELWFLRDCILSSDAVEFK